ncbi:MAG: cation-translocating P-type ATPase [Planctomycetaceae bacterium]|jgi:heavy metal translocating P-type ATPase|nr:cation-translocating P-type ATPase [Planctomycetaceae bacterium]
MSQNSPCCCSVRPPTDKVKVSDGGGISVWVWIEILRVVVSAVFLLPGIYHHLLGHEGHGFSDNVILNPAIVAVLLCGTTMIRDGIRDLLRGSFTVSVLVSSGIIAAIAIGDVFAAGEIAFIMTLGEMLEEWTISRARSGVETLVRQSPRTAHVISHSGGNANNNTVREVPIEEVRVDDLLQISPGETIPVDGIIIEGSGSLDEQLVSGESMPVDKTVGDKLFCGTINQYSVLTMRATGVGEDSSYAQMIRLIQLAESQNSPMERIADRWAKYIVPAAMFTAICVWLVTGEPVRAVTILVVFCPCAMVLATPTAVIAAIGNAAHYGVLVRGGSALEQLGKVNTIAFDKTGTLTYGKPTLYKITANDSLTDKKLTDNELLSLAASVENASNHPLAVCVTQAAKERGVEIYKCENGTTIPGSGMSGRVRGMNIIVGNAKTANELMPNNKTNDSDEISCDSTVEQHGCTKVYVIETEPEKRLLGSLLITDKINVHSAATVQQLTDNGCDVMLLTGDSRNVALAVAAAAKIDDANVHAGLLPEDKYNAVVKLQTAGRCVAMVGDGINDAPALKAADVGIAMGSAGSDLAIEAADVTLIGDDISRVPFLVKLSRKTRSKIIGNIGFSIVFNVCAVTLAALGMLSPAAGALAHNASSVFVVLNAGLLLRVKKE